MCFFGGGGDFNGFKMWFYDVWFKLLAALVAQAFSVLLFWSSCIIFMKSVSTAK